MKRRKFIGAVAATVAVAPVAHPIPVEPESPIRPSLPFDLSLHPALTEPGWRWDAERMRYERDTNI